MRRAPPVSQSGDRKTGRSSLRGKHPERRHEGGIAVPENRHPHSTIKIRDAEDRRDQRHIGHARAPTSLLRDDRGGQAGIDGGHQQAQHAVEADERAVVDIDDILRLQIELIGEQH